MFPARQPKAPKKGDDNDPPIVTTVEPIPAPYVVPQGTTTAGVPAPYVSPSATTATATAGLKPISLPRTVPANAGDVSRTKKKKSSSKKKKSSSSSSSKNNDAIETILLPPSSTEKKQGTNSKVFLVSEKHVITIPPKFLMPVGALHLSDVCLPDNSDKKWKLSDKLTKGCKVIDHLDGPETSRHRDLKIPVSAAEIVLYAMAKTKKGKDDPGDVLAMHMENNSLSSLTPTRNHRSAILTRGSLQFKKPSFSITQCMVFLKEKESPNIALSLFDVRGVHTEHNGVVVAYKKQRQHDATIRYVLYQTPEPGRFLVPLAKAVVASYTGVPQWAIPIAWSGNLPTLPRIPPHQYQSWMGSDGGFSSILYSAAIAFHVTNKVFFGNFERGQERVSQEIRKQQGKSNSPRFGSYSPQIIKPLNLARDVATHQNQKKGGLVADLFLAGLNALSFNLVFRKLEIQRAKFDQENQEFLRAFCEALGRALLYNVTLREVDFEFSKLTGFGETIGNAWAMNAQPLISKINFSGCELTGDDLHGLLRGLARIWCGGTALAEVIRMARNPDIPRLAWDVFFRTFVDPSTLSTWPQRPPPRPNLSFLQELDLRRTRAIGPGLVEIAGKLTGLRTLKLSSVSLVAGGSTQAASTVLSALLSANAPLEVFEFEGEDLDLIQALFRYHKTLKKITLVGFIGDGRPLLCDWPHSVPNLSLDIGKGYTIKSHPSTNPSRSGYSPGTIVLSNSNNFCISAMEILANRAVGLKKLVLYDTFYWQLVGATYTLADSGLETFHVYPPKNQPTKRSLINKMNSVGLSQIESFWTTMARSKTLRDLQVPDQLLGGANSNEVAMVGRFLKANRSVQNIGFDHSHLILNVEDVKILRSAFYGNKKVVQMEFLSKAKQATLRYFKVKTDSLLQDVASYKLEIKMLFKRAYSKYNWRWRDGPNRDKLPWIEKIRVAKREIGRLSRDQAKIASLLNEIMNCINTNKRTRGAIEEEKAAERLERRGPQLNQLAAKKKKFATDLVKKLRKAKIRGRQQKSAKMQVPRSTYYKSRHIWPATMRYSNRRGRRRHRHRHSYYGYYNDPYDARYDWGYNDDSWSDSDDDTDFGGEDCDYLESACEPDMAVVSEDPWANIDSLVQELENNSNCAVDPEYLACIHQECSELGVDVLEDVSNTLDGGCAVADKLDAIETSTNASRDMVAAFVDSSPDGQFDLAAVEQSLPDVGDYETFDDGMDDAMDADDAVTMYAGAGPRDLDDGGPAFGGSKNTALAGARRRARARKKGRCMSRVREKANRRLKTGYQNLSIVGTSNTLEVCKIESVWPDNLASSWIEEARLQQIQAMAESDLFDLPEVSTQSHSLLTEWSYSLTNLQNSVANIEVVLVTQCSIDRLPNLQAQLTCWTGKASIAVYLKPTENKSNAVQSILSTLRDAKAMAGNKNFDVAVTLVEGRVEDEPYPINYLRNVALLEAQRQHLRFNTSLDQSATLLVDVDFRPSSNLYTMLHSKCAETVILKQGRVVVCPAFESTQTAHPSSISSLKKLVDNGEAEGFHRSHFPQGHGPTQFDSFWEKSLSCPTSTDENGKNYLWNESYVVKHQDLFEPYIVMASSDVPLYDERFQGYGLNKVSHLASVAREKEGEFVVLPGVFLVAPAHERSESWCKIYGKSQSDDNKFNQLLLKGLYYNFKKNLEGGKGPVVSDHTRSKQELLAQLERESKEKQNASNQSIHTHQSECPAGAVVCY